MKELPDKFYEATGDFSAFGKSLKELENYLVKKSKEPEWNKTYGKDAQTLQQQIRQIQGQNGATDANNSKAYQEINKILKNEVETVLFGPDFIAVGCRFVIIVTSRRKRQWN